MPAPAEPEDEAPIEDPFDASKYQRSAIDADFFPVEIGVSDKIIVDSDLPRAP